MTPTGTRPLLTGEYPQAGDIFLHPRDGWLTLDPIPAEPWNDEYFYPMARAVEKGSDEQQ